MWEQGKEGKCPLLGHQAEGDHISLIAEFHLSVFLGNLPGLEEFEGKSKNGDSWDDSTRAELSPWRGATVPQKALRDSESSLTKEHTTTAENLEKTD